MRCLGCARHGKKASANLQPHHAFKVSTNHSSTMAIRVKIDSFTSRDCQKIIGRDFFSDQRPRLCCPDFRHNCHGGG